MNTQQAYELMRVYLTRPGAKQAIDLDVGCMYETEIDDEKHRCAVGCLLSPQAIRELEDKQALEGVGVIDLYRGRFPITQRELHNIDEGFLAAAQSLHDDLRAWPSGQFRVGSLDLLAAQHGLTVVSDDAEGAPLPEKVLVA